MLRNSKKGVMTGVYAALVVLLILTLVFAVNFGSVDIYYKDVFQIVYGKIFNKDLSAYKSSQINIIWALRLPKVIVAACTGAGLVLTGILMQAITKNTLADPYVLGISSGATAGAVVSLLIGTLPVIGRVPLAESSFAGALLTAIIVFVFGSKNGKINTTKMILVGMALSSFFSALTNIIIFLTPDSRRVQTATFWLSGSFAGTDWGDVPLAVGVLVVGLVLTLPLTRELDALLIGEDIARNTGVNTVRVKWILILTSTLLTAILVSMSGAIGFVGFVIPHISRSIVGAAHKRLIWFSILLGAIFVVWADLFARIMFSPQELPVGVITSLCGTPAFLWMLRKSRYSFSK